MVEREIKQFAGGLDEFIGTFEESIKSLEELKRCTSLIAEGCYADSEELEKIVKKCQNLRIQLDRDIVRINELMKIVSRHFTHSDELRMWYNIFQEKLREAQDITIRAMSSLRASMEKLDADMLQIRRRHIAIQSYGKQKERI